MKLLYLISLVTAGLHAAPVRLTCDYVVNPLGIDAPRPRLSWQSDSKERNWRQSAYRLLVATNAGLLQNGKHDVWDSGRRESDESVSVEYGGPALKGATRYYWTVQVWDGAGRMSQATPAWWETGLRRSSDWTPAKWITRRDPEQERDREGIRWIWVPGQDGAAAPGRTAAVFRTEVDLTEQPQDAALFLVSRAAFVAKVNGRVAGVKDGRWLEFDREPITDLLHTGKNTIEVTVTTADARKQDTGMPTGGRDNSSGPAGLAGLLKITAASGVVTRIPTGDLWKARLAESPSWQSANPYAELGDSSMGSDPGPLPGSAALFRKAFDIGREVRSARLYITALGMYRVFVNGQRVGEDELTPGMTDYRKRVIYQTYDVTSLVRRGENAIGAMLGDGWFASGFSWIGVRFNFLPPPTRILAALRLTYADGGTDQVVTDDSWKTSAAPVRHSEIYAGELYDARLEQQGWNVPGFDAAGWETAIISVPPTADLIGEAALPVRVVDALKPRAIVSAPNGSQLLDFGQNMAGRARVRVSGTAGTIIRMRFAEILGKDGNIYTENLRNANATDIYVLRGAGEETYTPTFTYHGFRYLEVSGYPGKLTDDAIVAEAISSAVRLTGTISTANDLINRMYRTGIWGQRSNFVSIPTDCPQRDERQGWMGDAQLFWRTGTYNADIAALGRKWMRDVRDAQSPEGGFTNTSPRIGAGWDGPGTPGWADAGIIVPWTAWLQYGDVGIITENWEAMERHMAYVLEGNPNYLWRNRVAQNLGDWLPVNSSTPQDLAATAYWAYSARCMSQMARAIGRDADAMRYAALFEQIRGAFQKAYITGNGVVGSGSQTSYALAFQADLIPDTAKKAAADHLVSDIESRGWHLSTGFLGTPPLLPALTENGRADIAYRLILSETFPSWGYMLSKGATTWWERWNSDEGDPAMNSFNHFAFGSVVGWIYRYVAGIDMDAPGFKQILIHPRFDSKLERARGEYDSVYGKIVSDWTVSSGGRILLNATIPPNTRAKIYLPAGVNAAVTEGGKPVACHRKAGECVVEVGSGEYAFRVN